MATEGRRRGRGGGGAGGRRGGRRGGGQGRGRGRRGEGRGGIRAFLAFEIPEAVRHALVGEIDRLRRALPPARWIRPENLHVTVKFLGNVEPARLKRLNQGLAERLEELEPVAFRLGGAGFFPSASQARVAWVGGRADGVEDVVAEVEAVAAMLGFPRERNEWRLHLTVARLDSAWPRYAAEELLAWGEDLALPRFECRELVCFRSRLQSGGPVYTPLERIRLGCRGER